MKNILQKASLLLLSFAAVQASAQTESGAKILYSGNSSHPMGSGLAKAVSCGPDTIVYPYLKELVLTASADSFFVDAMVGNIRTASQTYHNEAPVSVLGVQFWGGAYTTSSAPQTLSVRAYLYSVDDLNMPVSKLDSADVTVSHGYDFYEAIFDAPYEHDGNFAVAVRSVPNDTLAVVTNNAGAAWQTQTYNEGLAWRRFGSGVWNPTLSFFGQDREYMIFPIISYEVQTSFLAVDSTVCSGEEVQFENTSSPLFANRMFNLYAFDNVFNPAIADSTFSWNFGGMGVSLSPNSSFTFTEAGTHTVSLTSQMLGYYTSCQETMEIDIEVTAAPEVSLTPSAEPAFCAGGSVLLSAEADSADSFLWLMNEQIVADSVSTSFTAFEAGSYSFVASNQCGADTSDAITVVVFPDAVQPVIEISGDTLFLQASSIPAAASYQWFLDGIEIPGAESSSLLAEENGDYTAMVTDTNGCTAVSDAYTYISTGISRAEQHTTVSIFPNPSQGSFAINLSASANRASYKVYNLQGKVVMHGQFSDNSNRQTIEMKSQAAGIYMLELTVNNQSSMHRLMVK